jgi:hypothetical protein
MAGPLITNLKRIVVWSSGTLLTVLAIIISATIGWRPVVGAKTRPLTDRRFEPTPASVARGKYLVKGVTACFDCHSRAPAQWKPGEAPECEYCHTPSDNMDRPLPGMALGDPPYVSLVVPGIDGLPTCLIA